MAQHITGPGNGVAGPEGINHPVKSGWHQLSIFLQPAAFLVEYCFWATYTPDGNRLSAMEK